MIEYEVELCIRLLEYSFGSCNKTENKKASEIKESIKFFFDDKVINEAISRITR